MTSPRPGVFARGGQLFTGGPDNGWLQRIHPASRFLGLLSLILALNLSRSPLLLLSVFALSQFVALTSYLNVHSIFKVVLVPIVLFAMPAWLVAGWWNGRGLGDGNLFFLRTLVSVSVVSVGLHSIGLKRITDILKWLRTPREIQLVWAVMLSQVVSFSEIVSEMALARSARKITVTRSAVARKQIGQQAGLLFGRMHHRGRDLAFSMEARTPDAVAAYTIRNAAGNWGRRDFGFFAVCIAVVGGSLLW